MLLEIMLSQSQLKQNIYTIKYTTIQPDKLLKGNRVITEYLPLFIFLML